MVSYNTVKCRIPLTAGSLYCLGIPYHRHFVSELPMIAQYWGKMVIAHRTMRVAWHKNTSLDPDDIALNSLWSHKIRYFFTGVKPFFVSHSAEDIHEYNKKHGLNFNSGYCLVFHVGIFWLVTSRFRCGVGITKAFALEQARTAELQANASDTVISMRHNSLSGWH